MALVPRSPERGGDEVSIAEESEWDWQSCLPDDGLENFVCALQRLGVDLARSIPKRTVQEAVTPLGVEPTSSLLKGDFSCALKERVLFPGCKSAFPKIMLQ